MITFKGTNPKESLWELSSTVRDRCYYQAFPEPSKIIPILPFAYNNQILYLRGILEAIYPSLLANIGNPTLGNFHE